MYPSELYHHGVDGQKWGVKHGPPYPVQRDSAGRPLAVKESKKKANADKISERVSKKKSSTSSALGPKPKKVPMRVSEMSDEELRRRIARLKLEKEYKDLLRPASKKTSEAGKKVALNLVNEFGKMAISSTGKVINFLVDDGDSGKKQQQQQSNKQNKPNPQNATPADARPITADDWKRAQQNAAYVQQLLNGQRGRTMRQDEYDIR